VLGRNCDDGEMRMRTAMLRHVQTDPDYKALDEADLEACAFSGLHTVLLNKAARRLVILQVKSQKGNDFSLSEQDLLAAKALLRDGGIVAAYVAQVDPANPKRVLAWETVRNVWRNVKDEEPREGEHGPYWYLKANTFTVGGSRVPRDTWAPGTLMSMLRGVRPSHEREEEEEHMVD